MPTRSVTLKHLEVFAAIAHESSFRKAADVLLLSESAVSQLIKQLESTLGLRLFDRSTSRPVKLTNAGQGLLLTCNNIFEELDSGIERLAALKRSEDGAVAVGTSVLFYSHLFPWLYASFLQETSGITVSTETGQQQSLLEGVLHSRLDLAVLNSPTDDEHFVSTRLADMDIVLIGPPHHALAGTTVAPLERLASEKLIISQNVGGQRVKQIMAAKAAELGVTLRFGWEAVGAEAQISAVRSGLGIAALPYHAISPLVSSGVLALLPVQGFPIQFSWYLVSLVGQLSASASIFRSFMLEHRFDLEAASLCPPLASQIPTRI